MVRKIWLLLPTTRRRRLVLVIAFAVIAAVAEAGVVLLIEPVIRALVDSGDQATNSSAVTGPLVVFGIALLAKNLLVVALSWFKNRELFAIQGEVSERLLDIYIRGTNPAIRDLDAGQRTSFAITEPLQLVLNCYQPMVNIVAEALALVAVTIVLVVEQPLATTLLVVVLAAGLAVFSFFTRGRIIGYGERRKTSDTRRQELVRSVIESRVEVRGLGVADEVLARYRGPNRESAEMTARKSFLTESSKNVLEILVVAAVAPLAIVFVVTEGSGLLTMLAMFGMASYRALPALNRIMVSSHSAKFGVATADTLHEIFAAEDVELARRSEDGHAPRVGGSSAAALELRFDGFQLRNGRAVLDGKTLRVLPGEVCVLWGASGSGKTSLLSALVDGSEGVEIRFDGRVLPRGLSELEGRVGVTAQSPLVLPGTLGENLALGRDVESVDLDVAASLLDGDPKSVLHDRSIRQRLTQRIHRHSVSGGQAQRISLIRALDPSHEVVLLDEPTSALDARSAGALRDRIADDSDSRIFVIVTHDPELRRIADVVVEVG